MSWEGLACPGTLPLSEFCCQDIFGATVSSFFGNSIPRMLQACSASTSSEVSTCHGKGMLLESKTHMPWDCWQGLLQVVLKGK